MCFGQGQVSQIRQHAHTHAQRRSHAPTDGGTLIDWSARLVPGNSHHWLSAAITVFDAPSGDHQPHSWRRRKGRGLDKSTGLVRRWAELQQCKQTLQTSVCFHHISSHKDYNWQLGGTIRTHCSTRLRPTGSRLAAAAAAAPLIQNSGLISHIKPLSGGDSWAQFTQWSHPLPPNIWFALHLAIWKRDSENTHWITSASSLLQCRSSHYYYFK